MTLTQWIYTKSDMMTSRDHPTTFVIMVDNAMRDQYKKDPSIPLAAVVDSFDVLVRDVNVDIEINFILYELTNNVYECNCGALGNPTCNYGLIENYDEIHNILFLHVYY
jgi:hypothetical protein